MNGVKSGGQPTMPNSPLWISDIESKGLLRNRKLAGDWTLTIDARMLNSDVFKMNNPVYDDGSHFSNLSFFRLNDECAALEWNSTTLDCRIWILVPEVNEAEIATKFRLLSSIFSSYIDFRNAFLSLEDEPNELTLVGADANLLRELRDVVRKVERQLNSLSN